MGEIWGRNGRETAVAEWRWGQPQHLLYNRNALFAKGLNPHFFCLPILKREEDRLALMSAATSGDPRFFAGTDSAPHMEANKLSCCGHAGCFSAR